MEVHRALVENNLRSSIEVRTDGGLLTGKDVVLAAILGAEGFDFGKLLLVAQGCVMARVCEKNTCPTGIATHDAKFKKKYRGSPEDIKTMLTVIADDVRTHLAAIGVHSLGDLVGKTTLLRVASAHAAFVAERRIDLSFFMHPVPAVNSPGYRLVHEGVGRLNQQAMTDVCSRLDAGEKTIELTYPITTADRGVLATLSGALAGRVADERRRGVHAPVHPLDGIRTRIDFRGCAGQGFAAFLEPGLHVVLTGEANDGVAKSMSGGVVAIRPSPEAVYPPESNAIIGNGALYGATGGELYVSGLAGDRFGVRNSGAVAVVDGVGLHACEYMTRGYVVITGAVSYNAGAGMTGGTLVLREANTRFVNHHYLRPVGLEPADDDEIVRLLTRHVELTGSASSQALLANWADERAKFLRFVPVTTPAAHSMRS